MNLNYLRVFHQVAENLSFTKAAEKLYLTQPGVSKQIKELEQIFNTKLFDRIGKNIQLTLTGDILFKTTKEMFSSLEVAINKIDDFNELKTGRIIIHSGYTPGIHILPKVIYEFKKQFQNIDVFFDISTSKSIYQKILKNEIDIGIVAKRYDDENIISVPFFCDELIVVAPKKNSLSKNKYVTIEDLVNQKWLLTKEESATRNEIDIMFASKHKNPSNYIEFGSPFAIIKAIEAGYGISLMSSFAVKNEVKLSLVEIKKVKNFNYKRHFYIIYNKNKYVFSALGLFIEQLKAFSPKLSKKYF